MTAVQRQIDPKFNLPVLTDEDVRGLTEVPSVCLKKGVRCYYKGALFTVYNNYKNISRHETLKLQAFFGNVIKEMMPAVFTPVILPDRYSSLKTLAKGLGFEEVANNVTNYRYRKLSTTRQDFAPLLSLFSIYIEFPPFYVEYLGDPDEGIQTNEEIIELSNDTLPGRIYQNDVRVTIHLLILLMGKNFPIGSTTTHMATYASNRLNAVQRVIRDTTAKLLIQHDKLNEMQYVWNSFPKLKEGLLLLLIRMQNYPEITTALLLLKGTSQTTITCINNFLAGDVPTEAHAMRQIWIEVEIFEAARKELQEEFKGLFDYFRIIAPEDTRLGTAKFPNLARAAVIYSKTFVDTSPSFQRIIEPKHNVVAGLDDAARREIDSYYLLPVDVKEKFRGLSESVLAIAHRWGIDYEKFYAAKRNTLPKHPVLPGLDDGHVDPFHGLAESVKAIAHRWGIDYERYFAAKRNIHPINQEEKPDVAKIERVLQGLNLNQNANAN